MADTSVAVEGLWEAYRRRPQGKWGRRAPRGDVTWALQDVTLRAAPGEALGIVGGNGSGKSTLLRVLGGILRPTRGTVWSTSPVGAVIDLPLGLDRDLSGYEFLEVTGVLHGLTRRQIAMGRDEMVAFSGLAHDALVQPLRTYSAGMVVRLELAVALQASPALVVLDEVLAAADEAFQHHCIDRVFELLEGGACFILASHDLDLIARRCHRLVVLQKGRLVHDGDVDEGLALHVRLLEE